ncbi:hypothetical protein DPEC_G00047020 [Dallia pectoralis]|uniref:Uncharacterized protein n=1 Tax=Dallia pectoralis TaxID=75939 RepID=A0ACC2HAP2_DALPE|nr:hypothetical protein DPEC_G00047020 [Dallia pectoralis]
MFNQAASPFGGSQGPRADPPSSAAVRATAAKEALRALCLPTAAGPPQGELYYGWVNLLINIQPLDPASPRWPIKKYNWQSIALAAGCRGPRARGCDRRCVPAFAKDPLSDSHQRRTK